ncbi:MAG: hypothetical protein HY314_08760 [Acidobacteria bacterium]|nr:hypothetical protein [Acidobacteriota bacterium]
MKHEMKNSRERTVQLDLNQDKKEEPKMKRTSKTIKRARLILMAVLILGALSVGVHPQPASAISGGPWIPVTDCGANLEVPGGQYILTGDLNCSGTYGVWIRADDIHFDLNGFTISGDGTDTGINVVWNALIHDVHIWEEETPGFPS